MDIKKVTVVGAGTMGSGIAQVFAQHGFPVVLIDVKDEFLERGIAGITKSLEKFVKKEVITDEEKNKALSLIETTTDMGGAKDSQLVVEAVFEDINVKRDVFSKLDEVCGDDVILATNTSSISITALAAGTKRPDRFIGMHFMNPVPLMKLVEIIRGLATSDETTATIVELSKKLDKEPVEVNDYPGFVSNRVLMPMINEAVRCLSQYP